MNLRKIILTALLMGIGVLSANLVVIPIGFAKCFPVQHALNILLAVLIGTRGAVMGSFGIALLRNLLGTGTIMAFPGSIFGAFLASVAYKKTNSIYAAIMGEIIGTGLIGGLVAFLIAKFILGSDVAAFTYVIPFIVSSFGGSMIAFLLYKFLGEAILKKYLMI